MELTMRKPEGSATIEVSDAVFGVELKMGLIHQIVTAYRAAARSGTKAQKSRADVAGGGIKPWRQKGTGHARAGTKTSPLWRSGGVTFAARPRSYAQKVNRKMYRVAMRSIVSELARADRMIVIPELQLGSGKTRDLVSQLKHYELDRVLILVDDFDINLYLASRNIPGVWVLTADEVDPLSLVGSEQILITEKALRQLEERLA